MLNDRIDYFFPQSSGRNFWFNTSLVKCDTTPKSVYKLILSKFPTLKKKSSCSKINIEKYKEICRPMNTINYNITSEIINCLQDLIVYHLKT